MPDFQTPKWRKLPLFKNCRYVMLSPSYDAHKKALNAFAKRNKIKPHQVTLR